MGTYKAMNTFIDDVFAFLIDMPLMHRLSCFRDDIIFFVYVYQRWKNSVDKTRPSMWVDQADADQSASQKALNQDASAPLAAEASSASEGKDSELSAPPAAADTGDSRAAEGQAGVTRDASP